MATVAEVIDSRAFSDFCGVESSNQVPDGDTLGRFRNILMRNGIQQELFAQVVELLMQRGLILKGKRLWIPRLSRLLPLPRTRRKNVTRRHTQLKRAIHGTSAIKLILG